jgi:hypothetical protein
MVNHIQNSDVITTKSGLLHSLREADRRLLRNMKRTPLRPTPVPAPDAAASTSSPAPRPIITIAEAEACSLFSPFISGNYHFSCF